MTPATDERTARAGAWLSELHGRAREWVAAHYGAMGTARTAEYVDLLFAFGQARLGQEGAARELLSRAAGAIEGEDEAHRALLEAFRFRIEQALRGESLRGPLPKAWYENLEVMERLLVFVVDRARKHLSVLEPDRRVNPYRHWGARISDFERQLASLQDITSPADFIAEVERLRSSCPKGGRGREARDRVLHQALTQASLATAEAARDWLGEALPRLLSEPAPEEPAVLLEWTAFAVGAVQAATWHRLREEFLQAVRVTPRLVEATLRVTHGQYLDQLLSACVRGFIAFRLPDELDSFLGEITPFLASDAGLGEGGRLCARACLVEGWFAFGWSGLAKPVLSQALELLPSLPPGREVGRLACAVASAVRTAPAAEARRYYSAIFDLARAADTHTTATHYATTQLEIVEAIALSAAEAFLND